MKAAARLFIIDTAFYAAAVAAVPVLGLKLSEWLQPSDSIPLYAAVALLVAAVVFVYYKVHVTPYSSVITPSKPRKNRGTRPTDFPPPFPNGWYQVAFSSDVPKGGVKEVELAGNTIVLFRANNGKLAALDAFCPHLGANLAVGGCVSNRDCIRCPFHGWEFNAEGECVYIEGTDVIPPKSSIPKYHHCEVNQNIMLWWDAERRAPTWEVPVDGPVDRAEWYSAGRTWTTVNVHIQEIPENGPDCAHLNVLHKSFVWDPASSLSFEHLWSATWRPHETEKHMSQIDLTQGATLMSKLLPKTGVVARINQVGPGHTRLQLETPIGTLLAYEMVTPVKTTTQVVKHVMYCSPTVPRFMGRILLWALETQFLRDRPIWEAKKFVPKPVVSKADGPLMQYRRWFSQFYSTQSMSFPDALAKENMMDW